jgi:hypothetical protein
VNRKSDVEADVGVVDDCVGEDEEEEEEECRGSYE